MTPGAAVFGFGMCPPTTWAACLYAHLLKSAGRKIVLDTRKTGVSNRMANQLQEYKLFEVTKAFQGISNSLRRDYKLRFAWQWLTVGSHEIFA